MDTDTKKPVFNRFGAYGLNIAGDSIRPQKRMFNTGSQ
jgi:hypothetical protein